LEIARRARWLGLPLSMRDRHRERAKAAALRLNRYFSPGRARTRFPDGSRRVYCYHVRKAAGTSLHRSFLALTGQEPAALERRISESFLSQVAVHGLSFVYANKAAIEYGDYFYGWSHWPAHELALPSDTFTITALRDPVKRVRSYYSYLLEGDQPDIVFQVGEQERGLARDDFHAFLNAVPREHLLTQLYMFSPSFSIDEAVARAGACSFLFRSERFGEAITDLNRRLDLQLQARRERSTRSVAELTSSEYDHVRTLLEPEYAMLRQLGLDDDSSARLT
jgi:hypothetical protein